MGRRCWYFVSHLTQEELRLDPTKNFEIQILNHHGYAVASGYVGNDETALTVNGHIIPIEVLQAARRQKLGQGDYVDSQGKSVSPFRANS